MHDSKLPRHAAGSRQGQATARGAAHLSILEALPKVVSGDRISFGDLVDAFDGRAYGPLIVLFAAPNILPVALPGISAILGVPLILLTAQLMVGRRRPWLPGFVRGRSLSRRDFERFVGKVVPRLRRIEAWIPPALSDAERPDRAPADRRGRPPPRHDHLPARPPRQRGPGPRAGADGRRPARPRRPRRPCRRPRRHRRRRHRLRLRRRRLHRGDASRQRRARRLAEVYTSLQTGAIDGQDNPLVASRLMELSRSPTSCPYSRHRVRRDDGNHQDLGGHVAGPAGGVPAAEKAMGRLHRQVQREEAFVFKAQDKVYAPDLAAFRTFAQVEDGEVRSGLAEGSAGAHQRRPRSAASSLHSKRAGRSQPRPAGLTSSTASSADAAFAPEGFS